MVRPSLGSRTDGERAGRVRDALAARPEPECADDLLERLAVERRPMPAT
jgi:hypothetical protein